MPITQDAETVQDGGVGALTNTTTGAPPTRGGVGALLSPPIIQPRVQEPPQPAPEIVPVEKPIEKKLEETAKATYEKELPKYDFSPAIQGANLLAQTIKTTGSNTQPLDIYAKKWVDENIAKNTKFMQNYGNLSQKAQHQYIKDKALQIATATKGDASQIEPALKKVFQQSVYDKTKDKDYTDTTLWQTIKNGAKNAKGVFDETGASILNHLHSGIVLGTEAFAHYAGGLSEYAYAGVVPVEGKEPKLPTKNQITQGILASQFAKDRLKVQHESELEIQKIQNTAYSKKQIEQRKRLEEYQPNGFWENVGEVVSNPVVAGIAYSPTIFATIAEYMLANAVTGGTATVAQAGAKLSGTAKTVNAVTRIGVPLGVISGVQSEGQLRAPDKYHTPEQLQALGALTATSILLNSVAGRGGASYEAMFTNQLQNSASWLARGRVGRAVQGALIETAVGGLDGAQATAWTVAQGDRSNPDFSWKNVKDNIGTIQHAGLTASYLSAIGGAVSGGTSVRGQLAHVRAKTKTAHVQEALKALEETVATPVETGESVLFNNDTAGVSATAQSIINEIESHVLRIDQDTSPESVQYLQALAKELYTSLEQDGFPLALKNEDGTPQAPTPLAELLDAIRSDEAIARQFMAEHKPKENVPRETQGGTSEPRETLRREDTTTHVPRETLNQEVLVGQDVTDGKSLVGTLKDDIDGVAMVYNEGLNNYVLTPKEALVPHTEQKQKPLQAIYMGGEETAYQVGDTVNYDNQNSEVLSASPIYQASADGVNTRVGDFYVLASDDGNTSQHAVLGGHSNRALASSSSYYPTNQQSPARFRRGKPNKEFEQEVLFRKGQQRQERLNESASQSADRIQARQERAQQIAQTQQMQGVVGLGLDYTRAVVPEMFSSLEVQELVSNALKTGVEQEVLNTLAYVRNQVMPDTPSLTSYNMGRDIEVAENLLLGNAEGIQLIREVNQDYIIPLSSDLMDVVNSTNANRPTIPAKPTSLLLETANLKKESNGRSELDINQDISIDLLLSEKPTREELSQLSREEVDAITKRFIAEDVPTEVARIAIEADLKRGKSDLYTDIMERTRKEILESPNETEATKAVLRRQERAVFDLGIKLDKRIRELTTEDIDILNSARTIAHDSVIDALPISTPLLVDQVIRPEFLMGTERHQEAVRSVVTGNTKIDPSALAVDTLRLSIEQHGLLSPLVITPKHWESSTAKTLFAHANTTEAGMSGVLWELQQLSLDAVDIDTPLGRDIARANEIVELRNIAQASAELTSGKFTLKTPHPNSVGLDMPVLKVSPIQASINMGMVQSGVFLNDTPFTAITHLKEISAQVQEVTGTHSRIMERVVNDLNVESVADLTATQFEFMEHVSEYNEIATKLIALDRAQHAMADKIGHLESVQRAEGSSPTLEMEIQSAKNQRDLTQGAIAERYVQLKRVLDAIDGLRAREGSLYLAFPDNNFYVPPPSISRIAQPNPDLTPSLLGEAVDYDVLFLDKATTAYDAGMTTAQLLNAVKENALSLVSDQINLISSMFGETVKKFEGAVKATADQLDLFRATDNLVQHKLASDAVHAIDTGVIGERSVSDLMAEYAQVDFGLGTQTLNGVETYLNNNDGSFLPASALDESFFDGSYPKLSKILKPNDQGFIPIEQVREAMTYVKKANADYPTNDGLKAQAYLQATTTARSLRLSQYPQDTLISNSNPAFKQGDAVMEQSYAELGELIKDSNGTEALEFIAKLPDLPHNIASTVRFLAETAQRYMPYVKIVVDDSGNFGGEYKYTENTIVFSGGAHKVPYTVAHEFAHALGDALFSVPETSLTVHQYNAKQGIVELYNYARDMGALTDYASKGYKEFMAETFSSQVQADKLHALRTDTPSAMAQLSVVGKLRTAYDYFVDRLRTLFGALSSRSKDQAKQAEEVKAGKTIEETDAIHTGLTDLMALTHLYSKPTSARGGNYKGTKKYPKLNTDGTPKLDENGHPEFNYNPPTFDAPTPAGDYLSGGRGAEVVYIQDNFDAYGSVQYAGVIKQLGNTNRYELLMINGHKAERTIGTLPDLMNQFDVGRYTVSSHINLKGSLKNTELASYFSDYFARLHDPKNPNITPEVAYNASLASLYLDNFKTPSQWLNKKLLGFVAEGIRSDRAKNFERNDKNELVLKKGANHGNAGMRNLSWRVQLANAVSSSIGFLSQVPRPSNVLALMDNILKAQIENAVRPETFDAIKDINLYEHYANLLGQKVAYGQTKTSVLYQLDKEIRKLIPTDEAMEHFSVWQTYKHALERDTLHKDTVTVGTARPEGVSGAHYKDLHGTKASEALVREAESLVGPEIAENFEIASKLIRKEHLRILEAQYKSGILDSSTYHAYKDYEYYVPLLNREGDGSSYASGKGQELQGRTSNPALGYASVMEYMNNAQALTDANNFAKVLVGVFEAQLGTGVFSIDRAETRLVRNPDTGTLSHRKASDSPLDKNNLIYYENGRPKTLSPNMGTPRGKQLATFIHSVNPPVPRVGIVWEGLRKFGGVLKALNIMQAFSLVVASPKFFTKVLFWNGTMPAVNTQASFGTDLKTAMQITWRTYRNMAKNTAKIKSILATEFDSNSMAHHPLFELYQQLGGGITGTVFGQSTYDRNFRNISYKNVLAGGAQVQGQYSGQLPNQGHTRPSLFADYVGDKVHRSLNFMGDISNIPDAITRFSAWEAGLETLGSKEILTALADKDYATVRKILTENPNLLAKLNNGSKSIIGNFQERGMFPNLSPLFLFLNAGLQGVEVVRNLMKTPQGQMMIGALMALGAITGGVDQSGDDGLGLDGKNKRLRSWTENTGVTFNLLGQRTRIDLDYSLRPFYSLGRAISAMATGDMTFMEALSAWYDASIDTFVPLRPAKTDSAGTNVLAMTMPTPIRSAVMPLALNASEFSSNVDGTLYGEDGKVLSGQASGAYKTDSTIANTLGAVSGLPAPRWKEVIGNYLGEPYRLHGAMDNPTLTTADKIRYAFRDITPTEQDIYRYRNEFDTTIKNLQGQLYQAKKNPELPYSQFIIGVNKELGKITNQQRSITSDAGNKNGIIKNGILNASSDEEKAYWLTEAKSLRLNQAIFYAEVAIGLQAEEQLAKGNTNEANVLINNQNRAQNYYSKNNDAVIDILKTVK